MKIVGLNEEAAVRLVDAGRPPVTIDPGVLAGCHPDLLALLKWPESARVELFIRETVTSDCHRPYWAGSEGFVFGLDVKVDGAEIPDLSRGRLLLKVFAADVIGTPEEGSRRAARCDCLCSARMNLHLRLQGHPVEDRLLFAGAPILSFRHDLGLGAGGGRYVCYVMRNAGTPARSRLLQWRELREHRILSARERLWLAHDLARCVRIIEELGIAHCDISPDNVLVREPLSARERPKVSLVDFDLFFARSEACPLLPIHGPPPEGGAPGHEGYKPPPEMSLHSIVNSGLPGTNGVRYDRFALGLIIFELLTWCDPGWDEPLVPQKVLDELPPVGTVRPLGKMGYVLGAPARVLFRRLLSRDSAAWPSPQEWIGALEAGGLYQVCPSPMRSHFRRERQRHPCAYPLNAAFGEWIRRLGPAGKREAAEASDMLRTLGGWAFRGPGHSGPDPEFPSRHFRWLAAAGSEADSLLQKRMNGLAACPVCGSALDISGEMG